MEPTGAVRPMPPWYPTPQPTPTARRPVEMPLSAAPQMQDWRQLSGANTEAGRLLQDLPRPSTAFPHYQGARYEDELRPAELSMLRQEGLVRPTAPPMGPMERPQYRPTWTTEQPQWYMMTREGEFLRGETAPTRPPPQPGGRALDDGRPYQPMTTKGETPPPPPTFQGDWWNRAPIPPTPTPQALGSNGGQQPIVISIGGDWGGGMYGGGRQRTYYNPWEI